MAVGTGHALCETVNYWSNEAIEKWAEEKIEKKNEI